MWRSREFLERWTPRMFAGSIFGLAADTAYEGRLLITDPDGVRGHPEQHVTVRTRSIPQASSGGRVSTRI